MFLLGQRSNQGELQREAEPRHDARRLNPSKRRMEVSVSMKPSLGVSFCGNGTKMDCFWCWFWFLGIGPLGFSLFGICSFGFRRESNQPKRGSLTKRHSLAARFSSLWMACETCSKSLLKWFTLARETNMTTSFWAPPILPHRGGCGEHQQTDDIRHMGKGYYPWLFGGRTED